MEGLSVEFKLFGLPGLLSAERVQHPGTLRHPPLKLRGRVANQVAKLPWESALEVTDPGPELEERLL